MSDSGTDEGTVCGGCGKTYKTMEELQPLNCCNDPPHICASCLESDNEIPCPSCLKKWSKGSDTAAKGHVQPVKEPLAQGEYLDPEEDKKPITACSSGDSRDLSLNMHTVGEDSVDGSETKSVTNTTKEEETDHELLEQPKTLRSTEPDVEGGEDLVPSRRWPRNINTPAKENTQSEKEGNTQEDTDLRIRTTSTVFETSEPLARDQDGAKYHKQLIQEIQSIAQNDAYLSPDVCGAAAASGTAASSDPFEMDNSYALQVSAQKLEEDKWNPPTRDQSINAVNSYVVGVHNDEQEVDQLSQDNNSEELDMPAIDEVPLLPADNRPVANDRCITRRCVYIAVGITLVCLAVTAAIVLPYILTRPPGGNESTTTMTTFTTSTSTTTTSTTSTSTTTTAPPPPSQCVSATNFTQAWRTNYSTDSSPGGGPHSSGGYACDLWTNDIWFRFTGAAGVKMLDSCKVSSGSCGAKVAFWSDDPTPSDVGIPHAVKAYGSSNLCMAVFRNMSVIRCSKDDPNDLIYRYLGEIHDPCSYAFCGMN